jgi:hypothetical protein
VRRNWFIAAIVLGIVSIAVAALVMRLTEDDSQQTSPTAWADSVCTELATWRSSITSLADVGGGTLTPEALGDKLDEAETATQALVTELKDIGPPDLNGGDELKQNLNAVADGLKGNFDALKVQAEAALEADSPAEFIQALALVAPDYELLLSQIEVNIARLVGSDVPEDAEAELEAAFVGAASCQQLQANS